MNEGILKFYNYKPEVKPQFQDKFCLAPWHAIQIDLDGDVMLCSCASHMPYVIGNIFQSTLSDIWHNAQATLVRQSVADGEFTYCNYTCGSLNRLMPTPSVIPEVSEFPSHITLDIDLSCNLKCPSCRESVIIEKNNDKIAKQVELFEEIHQYALSHPEKTMSLIPIGRGEIFASYSGLNFLRSLINYPHNNLKLTFTSNGTLIHKNQDLIQSINRLVNWWNISLDASTEQTYTQVRGGNWNEVLLGLDLIKKYSKPLVLNFCIQQKNYHEIESFAELAQKYNARVVYQNIGNWGHWDLQWWKSNDPFNGDTRIEILNSINRVRNRYSTVSLAGELEQIVKDYTKSP